MLDDDPKAELEELEESFKGVLICLSLPHSSTSY
jgi:hypothetical protein